MLDWFTIDELLERGSVHRGKEKIIQPVIQYFN
jgi:hypothetical protein